MMLRSSAAIGLAMLSASPALAHGIHLGELAGHSHWIGAIALAGAAAIGAVAWRLRGKGKTPEAEKAPKTEGAREDTEIEPEKETA